MANKTVVFQLVCLAALVPRQFLPVPQICSALWQVGCIIRTKLYQ